MQKGERKARKGSRKPEWKVERLKVTEEDWVDAKEEEIIEESDKLRNDVVVRV